MEASTVVIISCNYFLRTYVGRHDEGCRMIPGRQLVEGMDGGWSVTILVQLVINVWFVDWNYEWSARNDVAP